MNAFLSYPSKRLIMFLENKGRCSYRTGVPTIFEKKVEGSQVQSIT